MKEKDIVQDYYDKLILVVNKMRLIGEHLPDSKIAEKLLKCVSLPERFEAKLSSLIDLEYISELALFELINSLPAKNKAE